VADHHPSCTARWAEKKREGKKKKKRDLGTFENPNAESSEYVFPAEKPK